MRKNIRVIQINGFRGVLLAIFVVSCLLAGFIAFPAFLTMNVWNYISFKTGSFPLLNFYEGLLLWGIIIFTFYIFNKKRFIVAFSSKQELTEDEVMEVLSKVKSNNDEDNK